VIRRALGLVLHLASLPLELAVNILTTVRGWSGTRPAPSVHTRARCERCDGKDGPLCTTCHATLALERGLNGRRDSDVRKAARA
jgi:hypothetical protein